MPWPGPRPPDPEPQPDPSEEGLSAATVTAILNREATMAVEQHIGRPGANLAGHLGIWDEACAKAFTFDAWGKHLRDLARNSLKFNKPK